MIAAKPLDSLVSRIFGSGNLQAPLTEDEQRVLDPDHIDFVGYYDYLRSSAEYAPADENQLHVVASLVKGPFVLLPRARATAASLREHNGSYASQAADLLRYFEQGAGDQVRLIMASVLIMELVHGFEEDDDGR